MFIVPAAYHAAALEAADKAPKTPTELIVIECDSTLYENDEWIAAIHEAQADRMRRYHAEQEQRRAVIARHPSSAGGGGHFPTPPSGPPADVLRRAAARIASLASPARSRSARRSPQAAGENATTTHLRRTAK